jgi:hypothetical protein
VFGPVFWGLILDTGMLAGGYSTLRRKHCASRVDIVAFGRIQQVTSWEQEYPPISLAHMCVRHVAPR